MEGWKNHEIDNDKIIKQIADLENLRNCLQDFAKKGKIVPRKHNSTFKLSLIERKLIVNRLSILLSRRIFFWQPQDTGRIRYFSLCVILNINNSEQ